MWKEVHETQIKLTWLRYFNMYLDFLNQQKSQAFQYVILKQTNDIVPYILDTIMT